jgi:hypothetical protein
MQMPINKLFQAHGEWPGGGADGSLFYFHEEELAQVANNHVEPIRSMLVPIADKHNGKSYFSTHKLRRVADFDLQSHMAI